MSFSGLSPAVCGRRERER